MSARGIAGGSLVSRAISTALWALVVVLALPAIARLAQQAVPWLIAVILILGLVRLWWPVGRRR
jgi:hypothetical protein